MSVYQRVPEVLITYCVCDFISWVLLQAYKNILLCLQKMKSNLLVSDSLIYVSCKFEKLIFEMAPVRILNVQFVFLFVHTVVWCVWCPFCFFVILLRKRVLIALL